MWTECEQNVNRMWTECEFRNVPHFCSFRSFLFPVAPTACLGHPLWRLTSTCAEAIIPANRNHPELDSSVTTFFNKFTGGQRRNGCVWKCRVPLNPTVFMIIIPMKNGYFISLLNGYNWEYTQHFQVQTQICQVWTNDHWPALQGDFFRKKVGIFHGIFHEIFHIFRWLFFLI